MKISFGSASLRAAGLHLAQCSAVTPDDRIWVRNRAAVMLSADDKSLVRASALTLSRLGSEVIGHLDATLLVGHPQQFVRQLAAFIAAAAPVRYAQTLHALAADSDRMVRTQLAQRLHDAYIQSAGTAIESGEPNPNDEDQHAARAIVAEVLGKLSTDIRHSVRRAAAGLGG